ncbi:hypothetical protein [Oceanobacillus damuensis]|uniref:hypothetical protein n=1 Tax=Oceanobacillus damuensis TaxID=937928 RepID=UPI00082D7D40|nr:hypothetical protein [Oceanobacillus damuensis]
MKSPEKLAILLLFTFSLFLTGCGVKSLSGESENWIGHYTGTEENKERVREFVITPKDNEEVTVPVSYEIISEKDDIELVGTKHLDSNTLFIESRCSDCRISLQSNEIEIQLEWDGNGETLVLTKK